MCPSMGWLTYSTDSEKIAKGKCYSPLLSSDRVVLLDVDQPIGFVCLMSRGASFRWNGTEQKKDQMLCGYALLSDLRNAQGRPLTIPEAQQAAARSTIADVHRLPPVQPINLK